MSIKVLKDINNIPKLKAVLKELGKKTLEVGVFGDDDAEMVKIARAHEFGVTIRPKNKKYLAIPLPPAKGTRPRDHKDLFIPRGTNVLAKKKGKNEFVPYFVLAEQVTIPERSFIRAGFDANVDDIVKKIDTLKDQVLELKINPKPFLEMIGKELQGKIQKYMRDLKSPPNAPLTAANKGSSNPLIDEGNLLESIDFKVK